MNAREILLGAINKYGVTSQKIMFMEEAAELTKELSKSIRGMGSTCDILQEAADVQIMLDQIKLMYNGNGVFEEYYLAKLERLAGLISYKR